MATSSVFYSIPCSAINESVNWFNETKNSANIVIDCVEPDMGAIIAFVRSIEFNFIVSLNENVLLKLHEDLITIFYLLSTLSGNFRKNKNRIPVFSTTGDYNLASLDRLAEFFLQQGEAPIQFLPIDPNGIDQIVDNILFCNIETDEIVDDSRFENYVNIEPRQVVFVNYNSNKTNITAQFFFTITDLRNEKAWADEKSNLWKKRNDLYYSFIALSKEIGEKQYYDIINWYQQEYEVLPLWYKRFGHVIKVLKGKRTLKSLFRKN
ncbi:MAG: hypothetical protein QM764_05510 [Chitinophagaceae bacterium]